VPFVAVEYQPKVRDFADSLGWGRFAFRSDTFEGAQLERAVRDLYADLEAARAALGARVEELAQGFAAYAGRVQELLLAS
jgi:polysaccharide pyruvyl transferase WcaK-like protein